MEKKVAYSASNRVGKFNLGHERLEDGTERPMLKALFGLCVVLGVEEHESGRGKIYICASDLFQPLAEGEEVPEYRIESVCNQPFENEERERDRINSGPFGFVAIRQIIVRVPPVQMSVRPIAPGKPH